MSRIGKLPVAIPAGIEIKLEDKEISVQGPKGDLKWTIPQEVDVEIKDNNIHFQPNSDTRFARSIFGTSRSLVANMIQGVKEGYVKELELHGVGFKAQVSGKMIVLNLGYSHPIEYPIVDGLSIEVKDGTQIKITGPDKQKVGMAASEIRAFYKAEPYKGKGVRYKGEQVRRKVGKAVA